MTEAAADAGAAEETTITDGASSKGSNDGAAAAAAAAAALTKEGEGKGGAASSANGEFTLDPSAFDGEVKTMLERKQYSSLNVALEAMVNQEKLVGVDKVASPVRGETSKFFEANGELLGVPKEAKDYDIQKIDLPKGMEWDQAYEDKARAFGVENHIPNDLMAKMAEFGIKDRIEGAAASVEAHKTAVDTALTELRTELKGNYDKTIDLAGQAAKSLGVSDDVQDALDGKMGTAGVIKFFAQLGGMMSEGGIQLGEGVGFGNEVSDAKAQIEALKIDSNFQAIFTNQKDPGHKTAVNKMRNLHAIAAGEKVEG